LGLWESRIQHISLRDWTPLGPSNLRPRWVSPMGSKSMRPTTVSSSFKAQAQFQNTSEFGGPLKHNHRTESPKSPLHRFHLILRTRGRPPPAARRITNRASRGRRERDGGRPAAARARPPPPLLRRRIQTRLARGRSGHSALLPCSLLPCVAGAPSPFSCPSRRHPSRRPP